jgi:hypothetical protein
VLKSLSFALGDVFHCSFSTHVGRRFPTKNIFFTWERLSMCLCVYLISISFFHRLFIFIFFLSSSYTLIIISPSQQVYIQQKLTDLFAFCMTHESNFRRKSKHWLCQHSAPMRYSWKRALEHPCKYFFRQVGARS